MRKDIIALILIIIIGLLLYLIRPIYWHGVIIKPGIGLLIIFFAAFYLIRDLYNYRKSKDNIKRKS